MKIIRKEEGETKKVSFDCPVDLLERLDKMADRAGLARQHLIANLLSCGVNTLEASRMVGVFHLALLLRDLENNMLKWADKVEKSEVKGLDIRSSMPKITK